MILEAEDNPVPVGGVRADERVDVPTLVVRQILKVCAVGTDGGDVGGVAGVGEVGINGEDKVALVGRPVLLDRDIEGERSELEEVAAVDAGGEERLSISKRSNTIRLPSGVNDG